MDCELMAQPVHNQQFALDKVFPVAIASLMPVHTVGCPTNWVDVGVGMGVGVGVGTGVGTGVGVGVGAGVGVGTGVGAGAGTGVVSGKKIIAERTAASEPCNSAAKRKVAEASSGLLV